MIRGAVIALTCFGLSAGVSAQEDMLCSKIAGFLVQAAAESGTQTPPTLSLPSLFATQPNCGTSLFMSGARSLHCAWAFEYRAEAATATFEDLAQRLATCPGATPPKKAAGLVNHPDSYDQRTVRFNESRVSLSLKDKASLGQTYIFIRTQVGP